MIPVKVTVLTSDGGCDVTRRFNADCDLISCYAGLVAKISGVFPGLHPDQFNTYWKDNEGDLIIMSQDDEVHMALSSVGPENTFKVFIKDTGTVSMLHPDVVCDICNKEISGRRYKCVVCTDYDLCATCEAKGNHSIHPMIRLATPQQQQLYGKRSRGSSRLCTRTHAVPRSSSRSSHDGRHISSDCISASGEQQTETCPHFKSMPESATKNWAEAMHSDQNVTKKVHSADKEVACKKVYSSDKEVACKKVYSSDKEVACKKVYSSDNEVACKKVYSSDIETACKKVHSADKEPSGKKVISTTAKDGSVDQTIYTTIINEVLESFFERLKRRASASASASAAAEEEEEETERPATSFDFRKVEDLLRPVMMGLVNNRREASRQMEAPREVPLMSYDLAADLGPDLAALRMSEMLHQLDQLRDDSSRSSTTTTTSLSSVSSNKEDLCAGENGTSNTDDSRSLTLDTSLTSIGSED